MEFNVWLAFLITEVGLSFVPGPAVLMVLSQGLSRGFVASTTASLGILFGNAVYFFLSAIGVGAIIVASHDFFTVIKYAGAAYLFYLGLIAFLSKHSGLANQTEARVLPLKSVFFKAIVLQLANPKALIFFVSLLPQFINPKHDLASQILLLGITSIVAEFGVLSIYGMLAARAQRIATQPRFQTAAAKVEGVLLMGAGVGVALVNHDQ
jgi:homoserine/homoserine lactone efflux protein